MVIGSPAIGRWIKKALEGAGIEVTIFRLNAGRGEEAVASHAVQAGVPVEAVLRMADWTSIASSTNFELEECAIQLTKSLGFVFKYRLEQLTAKNRFQEMKESVRLHRPHPATQFYNLFIVYLAMGRTTRGILRTATYRSEEAQNGPRVAD